MKKADPALAWWEQNSKCAYQEAFRDLDRALREFTRSNKGERPGPRLGFPRFKKRGRCRDSFRLTGTLRCGRGTVTLPRLGVIRTDVDAEAGPASGGRHRPDPVREQCPAPRSAGTCRSPSRSTGPSLTASPPRHRDRDRPGRQVAAHRRGRRGQGYHRPRAAAAEGGAAPAAAGRPARARTKPGSAGRRRAAARLARLHARVANLRADALHKATSMLAARYETIVVEDLNVAGMTRNRRLARAIADQGFGTARRMLAYKTAWQGGTLVLADRWFPSSKKCSGCGTVKAKLALSERIYRCDGCGLVLDRDVNAARNLLHLAASGAERRNAGGGTVRPRPAPGTSPRTRNPAPRTGARPGPPPGNRRLRHERPRALNRNGCQVLGQQQRVPQRCDDRAATRPEPFGDGGDRGHQSPPSLARAWRDPGCLDRRNHAGSP